MAAAIGVRGRFELPPRSGPGWLLSLSALLSVVARGALATTHWVVTEDGKIQQQVAARVPLSPHQGHHRAGPLGGSARFRPQLASPWSRRAARPRAAPFPRVSLPWLRRGKLLCLPPWGCAPSRNRPWRT